MAETDGEDFGLLRVNVYLGNIGSPAKNVSVTVSPLYL